MTRILLVEDHRGDARLFAELLLDIPGRPFTVTTVETLAAATGGVGAHDVVFLDLSLPDAHGLETLTHMIAVAGTTPIVVLTGNDDDRVAVEAVKAGAQDYLRKAELTPSLIARTAWYAIERQKAVEHVRRLALSDEATRRARFLSSVTAAIGGSLELEVVLRAVAQLLVPTLGDYCVLDLVDADGRLERVAHASADPRLEPVLRIAYAYPPGPANPHSPALVAMRTRQTVILENLDLAQHAPDQRFHDAAMRLAYRSLMVTPLIARGQVVGVLNFVAGPSGMGFSEDLRLLADEIGERIAIGIDNAQLYAAAQRAIRARDELIAVVSHDLRNPLGVVALVVQTLEGDPDALATALPRATRAVDRMQRLISDLLDIARIETGTLGIELRPVELGGILEDTYEQHRALALAQRITLVRTYAAPIGAVIADRHRLGQALANLVSNALKFTPEGGQIRLGIEHRGERIAIVISDSGAGIAAEHLAHVFDRFWQPERRRDGVGLGLAIVKGIVDAHGATVEVESTPGAGTTFRIVLPVTTRPVTATAEQPPLEAPAR